MRIELAVLAIMATASPSLADNLNITLVELNAALVGTYPSGVPLTSQTFTTIEPQLSTLAKIDSKRELAMMLSQVFFESIGLKYKEELACYKDPAKCTYVNNTGGAPGMIQVHLQLSV